MAKATANHAAEWLPAGLEMTNGSTTVEGKLCAARITPELRAKYDALPTTSTSVERLHAFGRGCDAQAGMQRADTRAGLCLGRYNGQAAWLKAKSTDELRQRLNISRRVARALLKTTIKTQRIEAGRAKRTERESKLSSKRARREVKATEQRRIEALKPFTKYSELQGTSNAELSDQLKYHKVVRKKTGFTTTQANWTAYVLQLQSILSDWNPAANNLSDGDLGLERRALERQPRSGGGGGASEKGNRKKRKNYHLNDEGNAVEYKDGEEFEVEVHTTIATHLPKATAPQCTVPHHTALAAPANH